jgi:hypothetical protein
MDNTSASFHPDDLNRHHIRYLRLTMSHRARFIEGDGFEATEIFKMRAALDQHAITRGLRDARENRGRRAKREGARRRGDEQSHCAKK